MEVVTKSAQETQKLGEKIGRDIVGGLPAGRRVLALYGELGSGKTTFIQGLARGFGIKKQILSPTFVFVRQYSITGGVFYHVDFYRLAGGTEAESLGLEEIFADSAAVVAIEWAGKVKKILPKKRIDVYFNYLKKDKRKITIRQRK